MEINIHPEAVTNFNIKAKELLTLLKPYIHTPKPESTFASDIIAYKIDKSDLKEITNINLTDGLNNTVGKVLIANDQEYALIGDDYLSLKKLASNIQKQKDLINLVSQEFLINSIFKWLELSFVGSSVSDLISYLIETIKANIKNYTFCIPIPYTEIESTIKIGKIIFKQITKQIFDHWVEKYLQIKVELTTEERDKVNLFIERLRKEHQGWAAAFLEITAEIDRAEEICCDEVSKSLAILRLLSPALFIPAIVSYANIYNGKSVRLSEIIILNNSTNSFSTREKVIGNSPYWSINNDTIKKYGESISLFDKLFSQQTLNNFQEKLLNSIIIYSKSSLRYEIADKLMYILVSLESILLKNDTEPIQQNLSERIAFLIGKNLDERKEIISCVKKIYSMRSGFIHHGNFDEEHLHLMAQFMQYAWLTFNRLTKELFSLTSKDELIENIEIMKLSH